MIVYKDELGRTILTKRQVSASPTTGTIAGFVHFSLAFDTLVDYEYNAKKYG